MRDFSWGTRPAHTGARIHKHGTQHKSPDFQPLKVILQPLNWRLLTPSIPSNPPDTKWTATENTGIVLPVNPCLLLTCGDDDVTLLPPRRRPEPFRESWHTRTEGFVRAVALSKTKFDCHQVAIRLYCNKTTQISSFFPGGELYLTNQYFAPCGCREVVPSYNSRHLFHQQSAG